MLLEDSFTVDTPPTVLWAFLQDVERLAPCVPGAELTGAVDDRTWKGKVHVAFGPVQMVFAGTVSIEERDDAAHRARLSARGTDERGRGAASATVESWLEPGAGDETTVRIRSDITITGAAAQLSRGLLPEVSKLLTGRFADCLRETIATEAPSRSESGRREATADRASQRPIGGFALGLRALWAAIRGFFARLFGRREGS
jgi:uncharacterized protein